ncbi:MAG: flavin reductase family protein [Thermoleophilia bacterium]
MKIQRRPSTALLPLPAVLVTVADGSGPAEGKGNIVTIAWTGTVSSVPPMLSIAVRPSRYTHTLIQEAREFVVNLPRAAQVEQVDLCGMVSGSEVDKWTATGFTALPASQVAAPLIAECPINIECVVRHQLDLGAHHLFIAEIVAVHYDEELLDSRGHLKAATLDALAYVDGEYWSLKEKIGSYGFSKRAYEKRQAEAK